jgi:hypothetical protein
MLRESAANYAALATGDFPDVVSAQNPIDAFNGYVSRTQSERYPYAVLGDRRLSGGLDPHGLAAWT